MFYTAMNMLNMCLLWDSINFGEIESRASPGFSGHHARADSSLRCCCCIMWKRIGEDTNGRLTATDSHHEDDKCLSAVVDSDERFIHCIRVGRHAAYIWRRKCELVAPSSVDLKRPQWPQRR